MGIYVPRGCDLQVYNATDGSLRAVFRDISPFVIHHITFDRRERKVLAACGDGVTRVYNSLNGALMKVSAGPLMVGRVVLCRVPSLHCSDTY